MRIYDKQNGYSRWFSLLNQVVVVVLYTAVVVALIAGIVYAVWR